MLSRELSRRARARLCQNLYCTYGTTETAGVAIGSASIIEAIPGAVGYIQPGVTVAVVDSSGTALPQGRDGSVRIRSIHAATEYVGDPELSRQYFHDGYFNSGDIGHLTPDGVLVISGREKTALNIGGDTVAPESVEAVITAFGAVAEAGVLSATTAWE